MFLLFIYTGEKGRKYRFSVVLLIGMGYVGKF